MMRYGGIMAESEMDRRYRFTVLRPVDAATGKPTIALELPGISKEQLAQLRHLLAPYLGAGFVLAVDDEVVARGPEGPAPAQVSLEQVQRLTEMAIQQHEYLCADLRRMREEYEQEFAQERVILRTLRQRWIERVCDDQVRGEDAVRFFVEAARSAAKKSESPATGNP